MKKTIENIIKITGNVTLVAGLIYAFSKALQTLTSELKKLQQDEPNAISKDTASGTE